MFTNNDDITDKCILSNSVAKSNHGAGMIEFIPETYSLSELKNTFGKWLNIDYTSESNEKHYSRIPRKILIEESLCKEENLLSIINFIHLNKQMVHFVLFFSW